MTGTEGREDRHQIYLVAAVTIVSLIAATIGGLVAQWSAKTDVQAELSAIEASATYETAPEGPPHPALAPLSEPFPEPAVESTVYVPIYSSVYLGDRRGLSDLAATLSIRNTSIEDEIWVSAVDYFDGDGNRIQSYLQQPHGLAPMGSAEFFIDQADTRGGPGANFLVTWGASTPVSAPLIEAVMIGSYGLKSISIVSRGQALEPVP